MIMNANIPVNPAAIGFVVGARGATINMIKSNTGAHVQVHQANPLAGRPLPWFHIRGFPHQVEEARQWVETIISEAGTRGAPPSTAKGAPSNGMPGGQFGGQYVARFGGQYVQQSVMGYTQMMEFSPPMGPPPGPPPMGPPPGPPPMGPPPIPKSPPIDVYTHPALLPNQVVNERGEICQIPDSVDRDEDEAERRELVRTLEESSQRVGTLLEFPSDGLVLADLHAIDQQYGPGGIWYEELDDSYQNPVAMTDAEWLEMDAHTDEVDNHNIGLPEATRVS